MNPMPLLLALLTLAYIGNMHAAKGPRPVVGSASGIEFVVLGALLGPRALGVLSRDAVVAFDPIALFALGWIGLGFGVEWGVRGERRSPAARALLGSLITLAVAFAVGATFSSVASQWNWLTPAEMPMASAVVALVSAETTRQAVRWVSDRSSIEGPLAELLADIAAVDDAPVIIGTCVLFAFQSGPLRVWNHEIPVWGSTLGTLGIGALLGLICSYLTARDGSAVMRWSMLLGCAWLCTGATTSIGLSAMGATFAMGLALSLTSPRASELRTQVLATEGALRLPALLLAGIRLEPVFTLQEAVLLGAALLARGAASWVVGMLICVLRPGFRPAAPWLGLALSSSGTLTMIVGLALSIRIGGETGRMALSAAALFTLVGELTGPRALAKALERAGEIKRSAQAPDLPATASLEAAP
jgi:hypothetical protein